MNSKYTGKLVEYLLDKISSLSSGDVGDFIGTGLLDKFLRKDLDERTTHSLASDKKLEVGNFVSGTAGAVIYIDELTKHSVAEIDKLYVRLKAYFEQLEIINVNSVGGKLIISPAGGIKCSLVETYDSWGYYRCYFLSEQDGEKIENRFAVGDLAYSKTFNAREGSYNKISNRYYWRLVVGRGENYIDLSKTDCDADSDEPQEGDVIVHRGNRNDVDRLNCLEFSSVDSFSPSITLYQGINDYSLADKNVIQFGVEKSTGKAFMNVYGDMFIGNRDNSSYIRYSPEKGVEIKGKLDIGTSFGDKTLLDAIDLASTAYEEDLNNLKDIVNRDILNILNLLDGAIETWFYDPTPTLTNLPASLWTTESDRNIHLGDLYYSGAGRAYRFQYDADNLLYYWQEIVDTDIVLALENAKKAQDTADSKRKIFVRKPEASDSYDIGDMWVNATYSDGNVTYTEDLLRAILSKEVGEQFSITHWTLASKYTDDTVANDALQKATEAQNSVNELLNSVGDFKDYVDNAFLDGIIDTSEAQAIEKYINLLDTIKLQVDKSYEEIIKNSILENTLYLTNLNNSYTAFSSSYTELIDTINSAISDSKTTDLEKAAVDGKYKTFNDKYRDYTAYLNLAINYIEETINGKVERALLDIGGYKYLKAALLENTSIEGGLIQSSMLSLGYTKNNLFLVMAGTNGLVLDKGDRTIASWFGGGMIDMFDYYDSNTKTFNVPEDIRAAAGLDRMDGTGYRAKGNLWWDETGVVHADPLSFFVGESTVGGLLASFLVVMKEDGKHPLYLIPQVPFLSLEIADYIRIGDALLKYDSASKAIYVTSVDGTTSMGFYASGYVSAKGKSSSTGGGGSASALYQLVDVLANSTNDGVLNAANGSVLMYNGSKWQAGNVVTDISSLTLNVNGSGLFTYDGKSSITANLTVPTKVSQLTNDSGYLTAITKTQIESVLTGNITSHTHSYLPLSGGAITGITTFNINNHWLTPSILQVGRTDTSKDASKAVIGVTNGNLHIDAYHGKALYLNYYNNGQIRFGYQTGSYYISEDGSNYSGNAATASKWATARTLSLTGSVTGSVSFDGSGNATLTTSTNHTHSYLPLSGGTMTGRLLVNYTPSDMSAPAVAINYIDSYTVDAYSIAQIKMGTPKYDAYLGLSPADKGQFGKVGYFMHVGSDYEFLWATSGWTKLMALECSSGNLWVYGSVTASSFVGNAATATALTTSAGSATLPIYFSSGKPVACTASSIFSNLSNSGNNLSVTVAGQNRTLTVNYSASAGNADTLDGVHNGNVTANYYNTSGQQVLNLSSLDANTWYPCVMWAGPGNSTPIRVTFTDALSGHKPSWSEHIAGFSFQFDFEWIGGGWGTIPWYLRVYRYAACFGGETACYGLEQRNNRSALVLYMRGGTSYYYRTTDGRSFTVYSKITNIGDSTYPDDVYPITSKLNDCFLQEADSRYGTCNIASYADNATKLQTSRTIWGQSFDGTANVSGDLTGVGHIYTSSNTCTFYNKNNQKAFIADYRHTILGYGTAVAGLPTYVDGSPIYMRCGTSVVTALTIATDSSIGIGTSDPKYKLDVNGYARFGSLTPADGIGLIPFAVANSGYSTTGWCASFGTSNGGVLLGFRDYLNIAILGASSSKSMSICPDGGSVGVGTTTPEYKLDVNGYIRSNQSIIGNRYSTNSNAAAFVWDKPGSYWTGVGSDGTTDTIRFSACDVYGTWVSYTQNWKFYGNIAATEAVTAKASSSDIRLKTDISDYKALSIIRSHKSIKYHWNAVAKANADIFNDDYWHYGLIAQDVQRDMPQMVSDVFKDYLVINYERLIPICWKGLQEVDDEVTKLKKKVRKLEMEIRELKQKEDRL